MIGMDGLSVGELARLAGVSVRTLHHYDDIGLLRASSRTPGGYRVYGDADLDRLRQILVYRALGFGLDEISRMITDPGATTDDHLRRQHRLLREQIARDTDLVAAIEKEMEARQMGIALTPEERFEIFGDEYREDWEAEARERWGDTEAWQTSQRRTAAYSAQDWARIKEEADALEQGFADALRDGVPADDPRATDLAEAHRQHLVRWFYECVREMHRCLGETYVADERFRSHYERRAAGLAEYVAAAIAANAAR